MPHYDYICKNCEAQHEFFQKMSEGAKRKCPSCGKLALQRLIGKGAGVIFKGAGFHCVDYPKDNGKDQSKD